jgi:oligopeptide/dipeptide ABC transporter ATP-binding protein
MCDAMAVMYAGRIVEHGPVRDLFNAPKHPYTRALLGSIARLGSKDPIYAIPGQPPNLARLPPGCAFQPRCAEALPICATQAPGIARHGPEWTARCWHTESVTKEIHDAAIA